VELGIRINKKNSGQAKDSNTMGPKCRDEDEQLLYKKQMEALVMWRMEKLYNTGTER
jgi:hypothetical protein